MNIAELKLNCLQYGISDNNEPSILYQKLLFITNSISNKNQDIKSDNDLDGEPVELENSEQTHVSRVIPVFLKYHFIVEHNYRPRIRW